MSICLRRLSPVLISQRHLATLSNFEKLPEKAKKLKEGLDHIQIHVVLPHLNHKTDLISDNAADASWVSRDIEVLSKLKSAFESDTRFLHIKDNFIGLLDGLIVHVNYRGEILEFNQDRTKPENRLLIRRIYNYADETILNTSIDILKHSSVLHTDHHFSHAYFSSELRRLIRNMMRISASLLNANLSALISLREAACVFPDRDKNVLRALGIFEIAKEIFELENLSKNKELKLRSKLEDKFNPEMQNLFETKESAPVDCVQWVHRNAFGFNFDDLLLKYMNQNNSEEEAWNIIISTVSKTNKIVNDRIAQHPPTVVSQGYVDSMSRTPLSATLRSPKGRTYVVRTSKRFLHSKSNQNLNDILNNVILKEKIVWEKASLTKLKVTLSDHTVAYLSLGNEENDGIIEITDGTDSIFHEIPSLWLNNWSVAKKNTDSSRLDSKQ